jgi:hypothetical protein
MKTALSNFPFSPSWRFMKTRENVCTKARMTLTLTFHWLMNFNVPNAVFEILFKIYKPADLPPGRI